MDPPVVTVYPATTTRMSTTQMAVPSAFVLACLGRAEHPHWEEYGYVFTIM